MHQFHESISEICIAAAWSDGYMGEFEKQALDRIHVQLGYPRNLIMIKIGEAEKSGPSGEAVDIPNDPEAQQEIMRFALVVCLADGNINEHEVNFLSKLANFLSISPQRLEELRSAAEQLLNPTKAALETAAPERLEALLPEQIIQLDQENSEAPVESKKSTYDPSCTRKALSELLFKGDDYGGELSLL